MKYILTIVFDAQSDAEAILSLKDAEKNSFAKGVVHIAHVQHVDETGARPVLRPVKTIDHRQAKAGADRGK